MTSLILASIGVFLVVIILLVIILLVAKSYLSPSGEVTITMNGEQQLKTSQGGTLLGTLSANNVFLSSACGGKGSCGQCRCQVLEGGGEILPTETGFFSRKEQADHWRLGCQVKVKQDMSIKIDESILGERVGVRGDLEQERGYVYQRVYRGFASGRTHGLCAGFVCPDQDSRFLDGL